MKKLLIACAAHAALSAILPTVAQAIEEGPESPLPFNVSVASEYRYRGISQTRFKPALQGGADYSAANGLYVGTWLSNIRWIKDGGGKGSVEWDLYGGYRGEIAKDLNYDVGGLLYQYPNNALKPNANTFEIYGAVTFGAYTAKYSHSLSNLFGVANSKQSGYLELGASFDLGGGWSAAPHVGHQSVHRFSKASYTDYSLVVGKDVGKGVNLSATLLGTDANRSTYVSPAGKFLGRSALVASIKYNF